MIRLEDGSLYLEEGERFPFICPKDDTHIIEAKEQPADIIECPWCHFSGPADDFSPKFTMIGRVT